MTWILYLGRAVVAAGRVPTAVVQHWTGIPVVAALHALLLAVPTIAHTPIPTLTMSGGGKQSTSCRERPPDALAKGGPTPPPGRLEVGVSGIGAG